MLNVCFLFGRKFLTKQLFIVTNESLVFLCVIYCGHVCIYTNIYFLLVYESGQVMVHSEDSP